MLRLDCRSETPESLRGQKLLALHSARRTKPMRKIKYVKLCFALLLMGSAVFSQEVVTSLPSTPLRFGAFVAQFDPGGTFTLQGQGWPALNGNWKANGAVVELTMSGGPGGCDGTGRYEFSVTGDSSKRVSFKLIADECKVRQIIVDGSIWVPASEAKAVPVRNIKLTPGGKLSSRADQKHNNGSWPSFRGPQASGIAEKQNLPERWDAKT